MYNSKTKKCEDKKAKLFGIPKDELKLVIGGGGVIIEAPRQGGVIIE